VLAFRLGHGLPDFGAALGTLVDEVDLRHTPMRLDVSHIHRNQSNAAGADNRKRLDEFVMLDIGWHVALLRKLSTPDQAYRYESNALHQLWRTFEEQPHYPGACDIPVTYLFPANTGIVL
jgi:hypothetical protein